MTPQHHRTRPSEDEQQLEVQDQADELLALWRVMPHAVARDGGAPQTGGRHPTGAVEGSAATVNIGVVEASVTVESGLDDIAAQACALLNTDRPANVADIITKLADWHLNLANRGAPLARHLRRDLRSWLRQAREAVGTKHLDRKLGPMCPDHRDEKPGSLLEIGVHATLAPSLLDGPPEPGHLLTGPACAGRALLAAAGHPDQDCGHESCACIHDQRLVDQHGRPTDWIRTNDGDVAWSSFDGDHALRWQTKTIIRCPVCRTEWTSTTERRILARRLAELGDVQHDAAALVR